MHQLAVSVLVAFLLAAATSAKQLDAKKCKELGFTGEAPCAQCDRLQEFVKDHELVSDCKQCCVKDDVAKYTSVELQLHPARLNGQPEIKNFVEKMDKKYSKLMTVTFHQNYNLGARLKCTKADGSHDYIRVDSWKQSSFVEFLDDRVEAKKKK